MFKYSKEKWLAIVAKGEIRFVFITGVLKLGVFFSLFYIVIRNLQYSKFDLNDIVFKTILLHFILILPFSILAGSIVAKLIWDKNNRKFLDE